MGALRAIPLLSFVLLSYALFALTNIGNLEAALPIPLPSGERLTIGDLHVAGGLILIYFEILKSTRTEITAILDHGLSLAVFILSLILFIMVPGFGTTTFFIIIVMQLLDVVAGFTVTIVAAKRDIGVSHDPNLMR